MPENSGGFGYPLENGERIEVAMGPRPRNEFRSSDASDVRSSFINSNPLTRGYFGNFENRARHVDSAKDTR